MDRSAMNSLSLVCNLRGVLCRTVVEGRSLHAFWKCENEAHPNAMICQIIETLEKLGAMKLIGGPRFPHEASLSNETMMKGKGGGEMNHPIFDDCVYMHLCATGQVDNLATFLEVEKRYILSSSEWRNYRRALDAAASSSAQANEGGGGATTSSSNTDWRYRISRWMLKVSSIYSRLCKSELLFVFSSDRSKIV
mgnify:CR=1 FL=1